MSSSSPSAIMLHQMIINNCIMVENDSGPATQGDVNALVLVLVLSVVAAVVVCIFLFRY